MSSINTKKAVGYKRPPLDSQYKPGQSGNQKGRPKGRPNMADTMRQSANEPVTVIVNGKKHTMPSAEAMLRKTLADALKSDSGSIDELFHILEMTGRTADISEGERDRRRITLPRSFTAEEYALKGDTARALEKDRQRYLAVYDAEDDEHPDQDTLRPPAIRNADRLAALKDYDAAVDAYRTFIGEHRAVLAGDGENAEAKAGIYLGATRIAVVAYTRLLTGQFKAALALIEEALAYAPYHLWMEMIRAHAWMLLDRFDEARAFYRQFKSDRRLPEPSWESVILRDFIELRAGGHSHALMPEIETLIRESGWTVDGPTNSPGENLWETNVDGHKVHLPSPAFPPEHSAPVVQQDAATEPLDPVLSDSQYTMLHPLEVRSGDLHAINGKLDDALGVYRINVEKLEHRLTNDPDDNAAKEELHRVLSKMNELAFRFVLARRPPSAFECITDVISHEPDELQHQLRLAHSCLGLGRQTEAKQIYQQHQNEILGGGTPWKDRLFQDFAEMRKAGIKHPLMDRLEREFGLR